MPLKKKSKAKRKAVKDKKVTKEEEEDFWTEDSDELVEDRDDEEELVELDVKKLKFTKLKDLEVGMEDVNIEATIDFVGDIMGKGYGEAPFSLGFLKDSTGEVKITFWGDDIKQAKIGRKVHVLECGIGEYRGQLQIYPDRRRGINFL